MDQTIEISVFPSIVTQGYCVVRNIRNICSKILEKKKIYPLRGTKYPHVECKSFYVIRFYTSSYLKM